MVNAYVKARCNLLAVLRGIEYLVEHDAECKELVKGTDIAIQFNVKHGPSGNLHICNGKAEMKEGKYKSSITLYFTSPEHFNKMIDGTGKPIPIKGFTKIKFLTGPFMKLADKLNYYLRPEENLLNDSAFFKKNTELTAYTAFFALAEIGNYDAIGKQSATRIPDGVIQVQIKDGIGVQVCAKGGHIHCKKGIHPDPRAVLEFGDIEVAHLLLNGKLDTFTGLGNGKMSMRGFIPMLDNMNPLLDIIPNYLS